MDAKCEKAAVEKEDGVKSLQQVKPRKNPEIFPINSLPEEILFKILELICYDQVAKMRLVSTYFNAMCKRHLNRGFQRIERIQSQYLKELKGKLPRRESARRNHPFARHCDILTAIDTRMNLLSMTFGKYIDANLCCFIPGKIIDETYNVLRILKGCKGEPPKTYEALQELRDISSMAMEHFDDKIVPGLIRRHHQSSSVVSSSSSGSHVSVEDHGGGPLTPSRLLSSPSAALIVAAASVASNVRSSSANGLPHRMLIPGKTLVSADELNAYKTKMSENLVKMKTAWKKTQRKQSEKIESLQQTVNAQAALISSQAEMLKEINKKILENEQKLADFVHARNSTTICNKRHLKLDDEAEDHNESLPVKKLKI